MPDAADELRERRLNLWRRAIALFDRTTMEEGPFHAADYRDFVLEPKLDNDSHPDIIGASTERFVSCELSVSPTKDLAQLSKYAQGGLTPFLRGLLGGGARTQGAAPFFLTNGSGWKDFPPGVNGINLSPSGSKQLAEISDPNLLTALTSWGGFAHAPPSYSLAAVPESDPSEIMRPLAGVLRLAAATGVPLSAERAAKHLSGDLWDSFPQSARRILIDKVATLLEAAGSKFEGDAKWDHAAKELKIETVSSPSGQKATDRRISAWLGTRPLDEWAGDEADEEDEEGEDDDKNETTDD